MTKAAEVVDILDDPLLTIEEVAKMRRCSVGRLYNLRSAGEGPPSFKAGGKVVYRASVVRKWLEEQERTSVRGGGDAA